MSESVNRLYSDIYKNYDLVNAVCSFGTMKLWRKVAAKEAVRGRKEHAILDIGTGTGELALEMIRAADKDAGDLHIVAMDFNSRMLEIAKKKAQDRNAVVKFELGDATDLKYASNSFDVVASGFAVKNIDDLQKFSKEVRRVLKKGGRFVFLDMARPDGRIGRLFIGAYWSAMGSISAMMGKGAYVKIIGSINDFDKTKFLKILKSAGFKRVKIRNLIFGPAFLITGEK